MSELLQYANGNLPRTEDEKEAIIEKAAAAYEKYMDALGFDWRNDPNSADTPRRVAKAFVNDLAEGCYSLPPKITAFDNVDKYDGLVFQGNIKVNSFCSHHHLPFIGQAHVSYIPGKDGKVIGLSKINRIVEWFSRRPQVQENLTMQIHNYMNEVCKDNKGVAVLVSANHTCAGLRGVKHDSIMKTARMSGAFLDKTDLTRQEFYDFIRDLR
jgi:GTP cyclohydrolase I|tara:strand:- start:456 stop:1091 length:636 start_codon:yes stop_codon:yes gene_type:complete